MSTCQFIDKHKNIRTFIHIPKTAGQSITRWIRKQDTNVKLIGAHTTPQELKKLKIKMHNSFAFVRNPYARAVSNYTYFKTKALSQAENSYPENGSEQEIIEWEKRVAHAKRMHEFFNNTSFDNWVIYCINDVNMLNLVRITQYKYTNKVETIFKVEEMDKNYQIMSSWFDYIIPMPKDNVTNNIDYREFYKTKKAKRFIQKYYKADLEKFDYSF